MILKLIVAGFLERFSSTGIPLLGAAVMAAVAIRFSEWRNRKP
jgi:uncharacterized membrane protein YbhN (UPF0104 family)